MLHGSSWAFWALLSAGFAALTAIFAKIGVEGVAPDLATFLRTIVIVGVLGLIVWATGQWRSPLELPGRTLTFLALSALATVASWLCYFRALQAGDAARVAPVDKLSVVFVAVFAAAVLGEKLSALNWLGIAFITGGVMLVAMK